MKSYTSIILLVLVIQDGIVTGQWDCTSSNDCKLSGSNYCCSWGCCSVSQYYHNLFSSCSRNSCPGKYNSIEESYCCDDNKCCTYEKYNKEVETTTSTFISSCHNDDSKCDGSGDWLNNLSYCCEDHCCSYEDKYNPVCYTDTAGSKVRCGYDSSCCGSHCCKNDNSFRNDNNNIGISDSFFNTDSTTCYSDFECPKLNQSSDFVKCCTPTCCTQASYDMLYNPPAIPDSDWSDTNLYKYNPDNTDYTSGSTTSNINSNALWSILGVVGTVVIVIVITILRYRNGCFSNRAIGRVHYDEDELLANNDDEVEAPSNDPRPRHIVAVVVETDEENENEEEPPPPYEEMI